MAPRHGAVTGLEDVHAGIERYYTQKVKQHGATPFGVDWTCVPSQELRFVQLLKLCDFSSPFELNDIGCGYGALLTYLDKRHPGREIDYLGSDLSPSMIRHARRMWSTRAGARFAIGGAGPRTADYSVASGIFNVRMDQPIDRWIAFIAATLSRLRETSRLGFAVNFMTPRQPSSSSESGLYGVTPETWTRYCEQQLTSDVEVIEGYGLREFTLLARPRQSGSQDRQSGALPP